MNEALGFVENYFGVVAQLGERLNGIQEVRGSIPLSSTSLYKGSETEPFFNFKLSIKGNLTPRGSVLLRKPRFRKKLGNFASVKISVIIKHNLFG